MLGYANGSLAPRVMCAWRGLVASAATARACRWRARCGGANFAILLGAAGPRPRHGIRSECSAVQPARPDWPQRAPVPDRDSELLGAPGRPDRRTRTHPGSRAYRPYRAAGARAAGAAQPPPRRDIRASRRWCRQPSPRYPPRTRALIRRPLAVQAEGPRRLARLLRKNRREPRVAPHRPGLTLTTSARPAPHSISKPWRAASITASVPAGGAQLAEDRPTWNCTVCSLMARRSAMALFGRPWARAPGPPPRAP